MTAVALLESNPYPTEDDIKAAFKDTLCRCGVYPAVERAISDVVHHERTGMALRHPSIPITSDFETVGQIAIRPDAIDKVTGRAIFADDVVFENMLHGATLRANVPHAILRNIDVSKALLLAGVEAVLTAEDIPGRHHHGLVVKDWPALVGEGELVRTVGDALAIVAADSLATAQDAIKLIEYELEELPVLSDVMKVRNSETVKLHPNGNLIKHIQVEQGDLEAGFEQAQVVLEDSYFTPAFEQLFMEPECSVARPMPDGRLEVWVGSQIPYADREQVAAALDEPEENIRIKGVLIGGGFGGKEDIAGQIHAALLARATNRPVKILYDRRESILVHPKRHATHLDVRLGADKEGRLVAAQTILTGDSGAYASLGEKVMTRATTHSTGPYIIPNVKSDCFAMYTNNPPAGAFRGFGVLQSAFAIETAMDQLALKLGINPIQIRHRNALQVGERTSTGQLLDESVGLLECINQVEARMRRFYPDGDFFLPHPVDGKPDLRRAWGFAVAYKNTGLGGGAPDKAEAEVELCEDGIFEARISSAEIGQGLVSVLQIITAEELDMPLDRVRVSLSDTDLTPDGGPTTASRQTYVSGNAVKLAATALRNLLVSILAEHFDCDPGNIRFGDGCIHALGGPRSLGNIYQVIQRYGRVPKATYEYWAPATQPLGTQGKMHFAYSFAAQGAEVEVNLKTGEVKVIRVIAANDVGRAINPLGLQGQIEGGVVMGVGHALTENFIVEEGRIVTDSMARYRMPSIVHTPHIIPIVVEHPTEDGPYGAKGVGEISMIPTIPAITNGVFFATGVRLKTIPIDQDALAMAIKNQESS
jgi:CO/xanthine dehydrogenase Mo-binding subunit